MSDVPTTAALALAAILVSAILIWVLLNTAPSFIAVGAIVVMCVLASIVVSDGT